MDDKIKTLMNQATFVIPPDRYKEMMDDAKKLDTKSWINKYRDDYVNHPNLAAVWEDNGIDKYSKSKWERIQDYFGSSDISNPFDKPKTQLEAAWAKEFSDIPREQFMQDVQKMSDYWDVETKERQAQVGKTRRKREVEDWNILKKMLANEYSQARYIDDPNSTPFGEEGEFSPLDNKLELANIGLQGLSLAGDALPGGYGYLGGPGVRLVNDLVQEIGDYGKPAEDILKDRAVDMGTSFIGEAGPNALLRSIGRSEKLSKTLGRGINETMDYADILKEVRDTKTLEDAFFKEPNFQRRAKILEQMPDNYVKKTLRELDDPSITNLNDLQLYKEIYPEMKLNTPENAAEIAFDPRIKGLEGFKTPVDLDWQYKLAITPEPGKFGKTIAKGIIHPVAKGIGRVIARDLGKVGTKSIYDKQPESENARKTIEWYKYNYARDWDMGFKPKENSGLLYQAWKEYKGIE